MTLSPHCYISSVLYRLYSGKREGNGRGGSWEAPDGQNQRKPAMGCGSHILHILHNSWAVGHISNSIGLLSNVDTGLETNQSLCVITGIEFSHKRDGESSPH